MYQIIMGLSVKAGTVTKDSKCYRVTIRHNLVMGVRAVTDGRPEIDSLSAGTRLAKAYKRVGCIDGDYDFTNINIAKDFAVLSLDFIRRITSQNLEDLERHNFFSDSSWKNRLIP